MAAKQPQRVGRTTGAMLLAGVAVSGGLTGCSHAADITAHATKLSTAQGSDVFAPATERVYQLSDIDLAPKQSLAGITLPETFTPNGYFVVGDGIITDAWFTADFGDTDGDQASAAFKLTEPTLLRRNQGADSSVNAVGILTFGGIERPDTSVQFSVVSIDDKSAEVLVFVHSPADVLEISTEDNEIAATITFDAK